MGLNKREKSFLDKTNNKVFTLISFVLAILLWMLISRSKAGAVFAGPAQTFDALVQVHGTILNNIWASFYRVIMGFLLSVVISIPVAFLIGWYRICRLIIEPWIQFVRTIPPLAYIPLVIVAQGVGESAKITVIFISSFLVMVVSIYQGVRDVDLTLIKAATVLGASDKDIFLKVVVPASFPYVLVGFRLGLGASLTTLIAAELAGASAGLGMMIQEASQYFQMNVVILGIIIIGIMGFILDRSVLFLEKKLAGWQELRDQ